MGIRFLCPNGHKLNVKEFLAGKRGICPQCDAKFLVPASSGSQVEAIDDQDSTGSSSVEEPGQGTPEPLAAPPVNPPSAAQAVSEVPTTPPELWYVRMPSGEQFGPASREVMQDWVSAGRIAVDAWVWCTGWPDWKTSGEALTLFNAPPPVAVTPAISPPEIEPPAAAVAGMPAEVIDQSTATQSAGLLPTAPNLASLYHSNKHTREQRARKVTFFLSGVVVLLFAVLIAVLMKNK